MKRMLHGAALYLYAALSLHAGPPVVGSLDVRALTIGQPADLTFIGTDLLPNPRLLTPPSIAKETVKPDLKSDRITIAVELAPGAQPGLENWWRVTDQG